MGLSEFILSILITATTARNLDSRKKISQPKNFDRKKLKYNILEIWSKTISQEYIVKIYMASPP